MRPSGAALAGSGAAEPQLGNQAMGRWTPANGVDLGVYVLVCPALTGISERELGFTCFYPRLGLAGEPWTYEQDRQPAGTDGPTLPDVRSRSFMAGSWHRLEFAFSWFYPETLLEGRRLNPSRMEAHVLPRVGLAKRPNDQGVNERIVDEATADG